MRFWVDMDNAPHVLVLKPIIAELERRGHTVEITARDYGQTLPLLRVYGLSATSIGRHGGRNPLRKVLSLAVRSARLLLFGLGRRFDAVFCHGARGVFPVARLLRLPLITMGDYEHAIHPAAFFRWPALHLVPDAIAPDVLVRRGVPEESIVRYAGLKEDLYVHDFTPDPRIAKDLGVERESIMILMRPPAMAAHYAVRESGVLFLEVLASLGTRRDLRLVVLPRTDGQRKELEAYVAAKGCTNVILPPRVFEGPRLVWQADLVVSGGGTMNREAAALGVPVVSIFQGPLGEVDRHLIAKGMMRHVSSIEELRRIPLAKRPRAPHAPSSTRGGPLAVFIADHIVDAAGRAAANRAAGRAAERPAAGRGLARRTARPVGRR